MPFAIEVWPERRRAVVRCDEPTRLECCRSVIRDLAREPGFRPEFTVLADLREIVWVPAMDETRVVADLLHDHRDDYRSRIALVVRPGVRYGVARMLATLAHLRGLDMEAFTELEDARLWLDRAHPPETPLDEASAQHA